MVGNLPGDKTDDFDDGALTGWEVDDGTAEESGGAAIVKSPGGPGRSVLGGQWLTSKETDIESTEFGISLQGNGNATATSKWRPDVVPGANERYFMGAQVDFFDSGQNFVGEQEFDVYIVNAAADLAELVGRPEGLYMGFNRNTSGPGGETLEIELSPINISSNDDLVLRLVFDEDLYRFQASFSKDGGATYDPHHFLYWGIEPLGPNAVFHDWDLGAQSFTVIPVPALPPHGRALAALLLVLTAGGWLGWRRSR